MALGVQTTVQTEIEENGPACKNLVQILMSHDHEVFVNCEQKGYKTGLQLLLSFGGSLFFHFVGVFKGNQPLAM